MNQKSPEVWPKNATDMIIITVLLALTQFAAIIQLESNNPEIIGNFRLILTEPVRFNNRSEIQPPKRMPIAAARKGQVAKKPTCSHGRWRSLAR